MKLESPGFIHVEYINWRTKHIFSTNKFGIIYNDFTNKTNKDRKPKMLLIANYEGRSGTNLAAELLAQKHNGLRAIVEGIKIVEANLDIHTVGQASWPNILGDLQLDASVMDGNTRRTGAVGALRGFLHPVEVAYSVMTEIGIHYKSQGKL